MWPERWPTIRVFEVGLRFYMISEKHWFRAVWGLAAVGLGGFPARLPAQPFHLPTANHALFDKGGEEKFYAPTVGHPWNSGMFGCVRSDGWQMHEGLDIRSLQHDRRGEPSDPVLATADGTVSYANPLSGLSNYGRYIVLRHDVEGLQIYSLYAHLSAIEAGLKPGMKVQAGQRIGTLGRSTSLASGIGRERAHVHFELNLLVNDHFIEWFKKHFPKERNDHGAWNGQNRVGLDPRRLLLEEQSLGATFRLRRFFQTEPELCRVLVRDTRFPFLQRYAALISDNAQLGQQPVAGYEVVLNYNGLPIQLIPKPASAFTDAARYRLISVNAPEYERNHCRRFVVRQGNKWALGPHGQNWLDLLLF